MKVINPTTPKLDYKDVLIIPTKQSFVESRKLVSLNVKRKFRYSRQEWHGVPILSSNMDTVSDLNTHNILARRNYMTCFPKHFNKIWAEKIPDVLKYTDRYALSCGLKDIEYVEDIILKLQDMGSPLKFLCIDIANGHLFNMIELCSNLRIKHPYITLIAGNVVTASATEDLILDGGVDIVKIGIGNSPICTTRIMTGVGYPQLSAVLECAATARSLKAHIIADGGISSSGDIAKAFVAGADFIMLGSMLAAHEESPGEMEDGYKLIYGMSSSIANEKHSGGMMGYKTSEGRIVKVPIKGPLEETLLKIEGGLASACTYVNAKNLDDLHNNGNFVLVNRQFEQSLEQYTIGF